MGSLAEVLYPTPPTHGSAWDVVRWWESRRLLYNKVVGSAGMITLTAASLVTFAVTGTVQIQPMLFISAIYGVMANTCFTLGPAAELLARRVWGNRAPRIGPLLFREGLIFSVGLTLFPIALFMMAAVLRVVVGFAGF